MSDYSYDYYYSDDESYRRSGSEYSYQENNWRNRFSSQQSSAYRYSLVTNNVDSYLIMIGRTGDGKSTFCNLFHKELNDLTTMPTTFSEGSGVLSHTHHIKSLQSKDCFIVDMPGLLDTNGSQEDSQNLNHIVKYIKGLSRFGKLRIGIILILNACAVRLDMGMKNAIRLLFETFGSVMLQNAGVVFTRVMKIGNTVEEDRLRNNVSEFLNSLASSGIRVPRFLPSWFVNSHPNSLRDIGVPEDVVKSHHLRNSKSVHDIYRWVSSLQSVDVGSLEVAQSELQRELARIKELEEEIARIKASKFKEGAQVEANNLNRGNWFRGRVVRNNGNGTYDILYKSHNNEEGIKETNVPEICIRLANVRKTSSSFSVGDSVYGNWKKGSNWYRATISEDHGDDTYDIKYFDGDMERNVQHYHISTYDRTVRYQQQRQDDDCVVS